MPAFSMSFDSSTLLQAFERAPEVISTELKSELGQGLRSIQADARENHRFVRKSGNLQKAILWETASTGLEGTIRIEESKAPYGAAVHDGSRAHIITPKKAKILHFVSGGKEVFARIVHHPGTKPDQFVYQAVERQKPLLRQRLDGAIKRAFQMIGF